MCNCILGISVAIAVISSTLQCLGQFAWSVLSIMGYMCHLRLAVPKGDNDLIYNVTFTFYKTYLYDPESCVDAGHINYASYLRPHVHNVEELTPPYQVFGWVLSLLALNTLWMLTTLLLLIAICSVKRKLMVPWLIVTFLVSLFDLAAGVTFGFDVFKAYEMFEQGYLPEDTILPAALLTGLFFRGGLFWLTNLILNMFILRAYRQAPTDSSPMKEYRSVATS